MNPETKPPGVPDEEWAAYLKRKQRADDTRGSAPRGDGIEMSDLMKRLAALPPETEEERVERERAAAVAVRAVRVAAFRRVCPEEFATKVVRDKLKNPGAFDEVAAWDGSFPGPLAFGPTGTSKTRAAWSSIGRMIVEGKSLSWFPATRLVTVYEQYAEKEIADEFWKAQSRFDLLFVDDLDKLNWQFESQLTAVWQFYDWVYREHRPCLTTTNKDKAWWAAKMGEPFARRLFVDAHKPIGF